MTDFAAHIRDIPDFPKPGILFKDLTPILADAALFREATEAMAGPFAGAGITRVAGIESRRPRLGANRTCSLSSSNSRS